MRSVRQTPDSVRPDSITQTLSQTQVRVDFCHSCTAQCSIHTHSQTYFIDTGLPDWRPLSLGEVRSSRTPDSSGNNAEKSPQPSSCKSRSPAPGTCFYVILVFQVKWRYWFTWSSNGREMNTLFCICIGDTSFHCAHCIDMSHVIDWV